MMTATPPETPQAEVVTVERRETTTRTRRPSGCFLASAGCLVVLLLAIAIPVLAVPSAVETFFSNLLAPLRPLPQTAQVFSTQTIVQRIQPLGQLVNTSAQMVKADVQVGVQQGALNACGFSADHVVQGAVEAGIDLSQVTANDITYDADRDTYILTLPAAQLTSCRIDYIRQYDTSTTACSVDWDAARLLAQYQALSSFRDEQLEQGILTRAEQQAALVLGSFVQVLTEKNVEVRFEQLEAPFIPESCQPQIPPGWIYNAESDTWTKP